VRAFAAATAAAILVVTACGGDDDEPPTDGDTASDFAFAASEVAEGEPIAQVHTCDGDDVSPALSWTGVPEGTAELALVVDDPDAPGGTFTHWLLYGLAAGETALPGGVPADEQVEGPPPLRQGTSDFGSVGYGGPCPPAGETHDYVFRLLALDTELDLAGGASRGVVLAAVEDHVIAEATLTAPYTRAGLR